MSGSAGNFLPHHAQETSVEHKASCIVNSWMDYGVHPPTDVPDEWMPNPKLIAVATLVRNALDEKVCGRVEILGFAVSKGWPQEKLVWIIECQEFSVEKTIRPEDLVSYADAVRQHYILRRKVLLNRQILAQLDQNEDADDLIAELHHLTVEGPKTKEEAEPFPFFRADELDGEIEVPSDFVEGLLTEGGASVVYGPSNCGKTFWILDVCVHVATGTAWRDGDHDVEQGAVVYFALEGSVGAKNRIKALRQRGKLPDNTPFYQSSEQVSLLEPGHSLRLAATVKAAEKLAGMPVKLVVFDTLARAMAGGDENSGQDMTAAIQTIDAVRSATGAHVCVVHHCGKDEARGARGHSSLRAAVDTEIEVSRPEGESVSTVRVTKQRDLQIGEPMPFSLEVVTLGTDRRGKPVTSCVLRHEDEIMASSPPKPGRKALCTPEEMLRYLPAISVKEWQARVQEETGLKSSQFYEHKKLLEQNQRITKDPAKRIVAA